MEPPIVVGRRRGARREGEGAAHAPADRRPTRCSQTTVRGQYARGHGARRQGARLPRGARRREGLDDRDLRGDARSRSTTGAGAACRSTCAPASGCRSASPRSCSSSSRCRTASSAARPARRRAERRSSMRIQPDEGISLRFATKVPGATASRSATSRWTSATARRSARARPRPTSACILDAMRGDATLFTRADEVEAQWAFIDPILQAGPEMPAPLPPVPGRLERARSGERDTRGRAQVADDLSEAVWMEGVWHEQDTTPAAIADALSSFSRSGRRRARGMFPRACSTSWSSPTASGAKRSTTAWSAWGDTTRLAPSSARSRRVAPPSTPWPP